MLINNRPRKCLGFKTPFDMLNGERNHMRFFSLLRFLSLFRYDIIYIKVRHKWFGRQTSLLKLKIEETV